MILPTLGLSRKKKLPCLHYFNSTFMPWQSSFIGLFKNSFGWSYKNSILSSKEVNISIMKFKL